MNLRDALGPLHEQLRRPQRDRVHPDRLAMPFLPGHVARALADLDDRTVVPELVELAKRNEKISSVWTNVFEALVQLDPSAASAYAMDLAHRLASPLGIYEKSVIRAILPVLVRTKTIAILPTLVRWTEGKDALTGLSEEHLIGVIGHARIRLGDEVYAKRMRTWLGDSDLAVPAYPEHYVAALGDHPGDVKAMVRFAGATAPEGPAAYDAIDRFIETVETAKRTNAKNSTTVENARLSLLKGLRALTPFRDHGMIDGTGPTGFMFSPRMQVLHHAALARLGDVASAKKLMSFIGEADHATTWIAAERALQLRLPGSTDRAAALALEGSKPGVPGELWREQVQLLDRAVDLFGGDETFWLAFMFDTHPLVQTRAIHHFARLRPNGACAMAKTAVANLPSASVGVYVGAGVERTIQAGLLALTILPDSCGETALSMVRDQTLPRLTRGLALQLIAIERGSGYASAVAALSPDPLFREHLIRARDVYAFAIRAP